MGDEVGLMEVQPYERHPLIPPQSIISDRISPLPKSPMNQEETFGIGPSFVGSDTRPMGFLEFTMTQRFPLNT